MSLCVVILWCRCHAAWQQVSHSVTGTWLWPVDYGCAVRVKICNRNLCVMSIIHYASIKHWNGPLKWLMVLVTLLGQNLHDDYSWLPWVMQQTPVHILYPVPQCHVKLLMVRSQSLNTSLMFPLLPRTWLPDHLNCPVAPLHVVLCSVFIVWDEPCLSLVTCSLYSPLIGPLYWQCHPVSVPGNTHSWSRLDQVTSNIYKVNITPSG